MVNPYDDIRVGSVTLVYSIVKRGWVYPGLSVIRNPLRAAMVVYLMMQEDK